MDKTFEQTFRDMANCKVKQQYHVAASEKCT